VVDTVELAPGQTMYEIVNVDGTARIDYTADGSAPLVGGTPTGRVLPPCICVDTIFVNPNGSTVIKLISAGTPHYTIQTTAGPESQQVAPT